MNAYVQMPDEIRLTTILNIQRRPFCAMARQRSASATPIFYG